MPEAKLFLIDTFGFLFRAHHARARTGAPPMRTSAGLPTETVFIFNNMLKRLLSTYKPVHLAAVWESDGKTLREQEYEKYKANRTETPPELMQQFPYIRRLLEALRIPILEYPGYEADDVIGTLSHRGVEAGLDVMIVSSDKDMLQLVTDRVLMLNPAKGDELYDAAKVKEFMGVEPSQVADLLALKGDSVDNIPGAPGIGDKGARDLIQQFGSVEAAMAGADQVQRKAYRESLQNNRELIELSKKLATISTDVPMEWSLEKTTVQAPDPEALRVLYTELEFFSQVKELKPSVESVALDLRQLDEAGVVAWLPESAPVAVVIGPTSIGLSAKDGEGVCADIALLDGLKAFLEDAQRPKMAHDVKSVLVELDRHGIHGRGFVDDSMLYAFLLSADPAACGLNIAVSRYLQRQMGASIEEAAAHTFALAAVLRSEVEKRGFRKIYEEIDLPLAPVLARMERTGIRIDPAALGSMSIKMEHEIERLSGEIYALAGHPFNINSPQQLGRVLFEEMAIPHGKSMSTAADVLELLSESHPIAKLVLEFRQLTKLKGTYVDALPLLIHPETGRLHTTFNPAGAATGRLSSSNPNLQNIPIRSELGREIRAAFVPEPGWKLVIADYSQIELRLLAHMSGDPVLVEAFQSGEDIHTRTASEVFGIMPILVTPEMRRNAKAVNFGIVYGLSAFGLAGQLGIPRQEAQRYIDNYFARYAGVRRFLDSTIAAVRKSGCTHTLFGRERPIPDMDARNSNARGFAERTAVNTPLQGTAADLLKLAMIRIQARIDAASMKGRLLLQVHDELVLEAPVDEVEALSKMVKHEMENVFKLDVPLEAEIGAGDNWRDAK